MPQLPFYAFAMEQQKFNLAGVSFAIVRRGESRIQRLSARKRSAAVRGPGQIAVFEGMTFDEYAARWAVELEHIASFLCARRLPRWIRRFLREEVARLASIAT